MKRLSLLAVTLTLLLLIECSALGLYTYRTLQRETQPERLVDRAESLLVENYSHVKQSWLDQTRTRVPEVADKFSQQLIARAPTVRQRLEAATLHELEQGIDNAVELSADEFRQWLRDNHDAIEEAFIQVEQAPHEARLLVLDTEASLGEQLGLNMRDQARLALEVYRLFNDKLERLADAESNLTRQERLERRAVRILKALTESP